MAGVAQPSEEVRILGRFEPSVLDPATIEQELRPLLPRCCQRMTISVRVPRGDAPHPGNLVWHQDDDGPRGSTRHMVVWASEMPTEVRRSDGTRMQADAGDLVWFDNMRAFHRQPADTDESRRWFVAVRCRGAEES